MSSSEAFSELSGSSNTDEIYFHSGEKLSATEASRLMSDLPSKVVFCAGAQWAGKTTFLARVGELLRNGRMKDALFAGSRTLCAFERVSWLATISSGRGRPDTKRTYRAESDTFFHLRLQPRTDKRQMHLLISDLPGELYPDLLASLEACKEHKAFKCAQHLNVFVDCKSLTNTATRHAEKDACLRFLSRAKFAVQYPRLLHVTIVFSRSDYMTNASDSKDHIRYCDSIETEIKNRFGTTFATVYFAKVAARPDGSSPTLSEIQNVFGRWIGLPHVQQFEPSPREGNPARDFFAFGIK